MKRLPLLVGVMPLVVCAHPHDLPFTFIKHKMSDGHPVYTNIPQSCFKGGVMTCWDYHPVAGKRSDSVPTEQGPTILMKEPDSVKMNPGSSAETR